jgi:hypothetical protein
MNLYLLFSHNLTPEQIQDAQENWQVAACIFLPKQLQDLWSTFRQNLLRSKITYNLFLNGSEMPKQAIWFLYKATTELPT